LQREIFIANLFLGQNALCLYEVLQATQIENGPIDGVA